MSRSHERRIDALEAQCGVPDLEAETKAQARYEQYRGLWDELAETMTAEHLTIIQDDIDAGNLYPRPDGSILATTEAHPLTAHASLMVLTRFIGKGQGPFTVPAVIGDLLIEHGRDLAFLHDCRDCGYRVPLVMGSRRAGNGPRYGISRRLFATCPLCGGPVGYAAYYLAKEHAA